jgi:heptosyltransferase-2
MSSIGDVILTSPLIRQLHENFPKTQIDFLIRTEYADLVKYNPYLSNILQFDVNTGYKGLRELKYFVKKQGYDIVIDLHRNFRSFILRRFSPKPTILKINKNRIIRLLRVKFNINLYKRFHDKNISIAEKYLKVASNLMPIKNDLRLELFLPQKVADKSKQLWRRLESEGFHVIIAPGARHFTKRWPPELYSELILKINQTFGWRTLLVGSKDETSLIQDVQKKTGEASEFSAGYFSLLETAALIKSAPLFISNDSGLMHIAAAFETPQIAIFGSTTQELGFFPINPNASVVENKNLNCRPCTHIGRKSCPKKHFKCMVEITPQKVLNVVQEMMGKSAHSHKILINHQ